MNCTEIEFRGRGCGVSQNDRLEAFLREHPGEWIDMPTLARVITETGIGAAVHSRVSDLRSMRGMTIEHKNVFATEEGERVCCSRYRYVPEEGATRPEEAQGEVLAGGVVTEVAGGASATVGGNPSAPCSPPFAYVPDQVLFPFVGEVMK